MSPIKMISDREVALDAENPFLTADWGAPKHIKTLITTRQGGVSQPPYQSMNLGLHVGDNAEHVQQNRALVAQKTGLPVCYLNQIHGKVVVNAQEALNLNVDADASVDRSGKVACGVMTADCLPVLLTDIDGTVVGAAHAGWRGLAGGVLEATVEKMITQPKHIFAFLGPAIGPDAFEVGQDVKDAFCQQTTEAAQFFIPINEKQYLADIYALARLRLNQMGVEQISGGEYCTVLQRDLFFSYRRDGGQTGRMLSTIWIDH